MEKENEYIVVKLPKSGNSAFLKTDLTYGEHLDLQTVMFKAAGMDPLNKTASIDGSVMIEYNMKKIMLVVQYFEASNGDRLEVSENFIKSLPKDDGELLEQKVEELIEDGKKK